MKTLIAALSGMGAWAAATAYAQMQPGGVAMQTAHTALAEDVHFFHNSVLLPIITVIVLFVLALLLWVMFRYNSKANPEPRKFSHNTLVEIFWTAGPIVILLIIALFSFDLLYKEDVIPDGKQVVATGDGQTVDFTFPNDFSAHRTVVRPEHIQVLVDEGGEMKKLANRADYRLKGLGDDNVVVSFNEAPPAGERIVIRGGRSVVGQGADQQIALAPTMTLKVTGYQWGWSYAYPDYGDFEFTSNMLPEDQVSDPLKRNLEVDNHIVVPAGETVCVTTTARDVIHSWAMPAFAIKIDAVPGRINEAWFATLSEGVYYGQCSEICGIKHAFMPIVVEAVSRPKFEAWVDSQRELAGLEPMFGSDKVKLAQAPAGAAAK